MVITVKFYNLVADQMRKKSETRSFRDGSTVGDLIRELASENVRFHRLAYTLEGKLSNILRFFQNDVEVSTLDAPLKEGDILSIFIAVSGGGAEPGLEI